MLERLKPLADQQEVLRVFSGLQTYYVGKLGSVDVVLTTCRAGSGTRDGSALVIPEAIERARPRAVLAVGMAFGGYTDKLRIGDILVSTQLIPYEMSRKQAGDDIPRGGVQDAGALLLNRFLEERRWTFLRSDSYECRVQDGPILSGEKLVDSLDFKTEQFEAYPEAIGGEMEGSGLYAGSERRGISEWLVVKAVCDWADGSKHKKYQSFAAAVAVAFVEHVFTPQGVLDDLSPFKPSDRVMTSAAIDSAIVANNAESIVAAGNVAYGNQSIIQGTNITVGDRHIHYGGSTLEQLEAIEGLVEAGEFDRASASLDRLEKAHWTGMLPAQKYQHRKLQGNILINKGERIKAASLFHQAADFNPSDEKSQVLHAVAHFIEGDEIKAYAMASELIRRYPYLKEARVIWIRSSPKELLPEALLPPPWSGLEPEVATALAERLLQNGRPSDALQVLNEACQPGKKFEYFYAMANAYQSVIDMHLHEPRPIEDAVLVAAQDAARKALSLYKGSQLLARLPLMLTLASALRLRNETDEEWVVLARAHEIAPEADAVQCRRATWLTEHGRYSEAIEALDDVLKRGQEPVAPILLTLPLMKRNEPGDIARAQTLLQSVADNVELNETMRRDAVEFMIDLSGRAHDWVECRNTIMKYSSLLGVFRAEEAQANAFIEEGDQESAAVIARKLYNRRSEFANMLTRLGILLQRSGANEEAFDVLSPIAPQDKWENSTIALFLAARDTDKQEFFIRLCRSLATAGITNASIADAWTVALARRGEFASAIDVAKDYLAKQEDPFMRLRLSALAVTAKRPELVEQDVQKFPKAQAGLGPAARLIVEVLRFANRAEDAIRFAYDNFRLNRTASEAWDAVIVSFLPIFGEVDHVEPKSVDQQSAVRFREADNSNWLIIEDHNPELSQDEYPPTHSFAKAMLGHQVGDEVRMPAKAHLPPRSYLIEEIQSKYVLCYRRCLDNWERQFPETPGPQMLMAPQSLEELDAALLPMLTASAEHVKAVDRHYAENVCSFHLVARQLNFSVFEAMAHLIVETRSAIRCSHAENSSAPLVSLLESKRQLILHSSALSTLLLLDDIRIVQRSKRRIAIARATIDELTHYMHATNGRSSGGLRLHDGHVIIEETDENRRSNHIGAIGRMFQAIEENCEIFAESNHALIDPNEWDVWAKLGGAGAPESLHRALREDALLWIDDAALSFFAERKGVSSVWTQLVYDHLARDSMIETSVADDVAARLLGWRYTPTRITPGAFVAAARLAKWDASTWPLSQLLRDFMAADWPQSATVALSSYVLRELWRVAPTDVTASAVTIALLDHILARSDGRRIIATILAVLERIFGVDVLGYERAVEAIYAWLRARAPK